jgi:hypothetical protein
MRMLIGLIVVDVLLFLLILVGGAGLEYHDQHLIALTKRLTVLEGNQPLVDALERLTVVESVVQTLKAKNIELEQRLASVEHFTC